jgi:general secretion pathway protein A
MDILEYFKLNEQPFRIGPDPRYLYLSDLVKEALAKCEYMARERIGPIYIYGPVGSGKTSISRRLYDRLSPDERYNIQLLISPNIKSANALLRIILETFDVTTNRVYDQSLRNFEAFLLKKHKESQTPVLIIDEAQNLSRDCLKLIHYLLNFETATAKLLQLIVVGQEELGQRILQYPELASRMFPIAMLSMNEQDLQGMIEFRWYVAGGKNDPPFEKAAYKAIFTYSKGLPRDAVKLCDTLLLELASEDRKVASAKDVERVAKGLNLKV